MDNNTPITKADLSAALQQFTEQISGHLDERLKTTEKRITDYIDERTRDMQTELLRGFRSYSESISIRMAKLTADTGNIDTATDKRMTVIEDRLSEIERRLPPPPHH